MKGKLYVGAVFAGLRKHNPANKSRVTCNWRETVRVRHDAGTGNVAGYPHQRWLNRAQQQKEGYTPGTSIFIPQLNRATYCLTVDQGVLRG